MKPRYYQDLQRAFDLQFEARSAVIKYLAWLEVMQGRNYFPLVVESGERMEADEEIERQHQHAMMARAALDGIFDEEGGGT